MVVCAHIWKWRAWMDTAVMSRSCLEGFSNVKEPSVTRAPNATKILTSKRVEKKKNKRKKKSKLLCA